MSTWRPDELWVAREGKRPFQLRLFDYQPQWCAYTNALYTKGSDNKTIGVLIKNESMFPEGRSLKPGEFCRVEITIHHAKTPKPGTIWKDASERFFIVLPITQLEKTTNTIVLRRISIKTQPDPPNCPPEDVLILPETFKDNLIIRSLEYWRDRVSNTSSPIFRPITGAQDLPDWMRKDLGIKPFPWEII